MHKNCCLLGFGLVVLMGCNRGAVAPGVTVDKSGNKTTVKFEGGAVVSGEALTLPDDFPKDIPVYPGATIKVSSTQPKTHLVVMSTPDSSQKVLAFYKNQMEKDWKSTNIVNLPDGGMQHWKQDKRHISVFTGKDGEATAITLTVSKE